MRHADDMLNRIKRSDDKIDNAVFARCISEAASDVDRDEDVHSEFPTPVEYPFAAKTEVPVCIPCLKIEHRIS